MTDPQQPDGFPPAPPPAPAQPPAQSQTPVSPDHRIPQVPPIPQAPAHPAHQAPPNVYQAPAGAYQVPSGGYGAPSGGYAVPATPEKRPAALGVFALVLSLVVAVALPVIAGFVCWEIGYRIPEATTSLSEQDVESLAFLSPARDQVLWAELTFWTGTVLGIAAIVLGIIAIVKRRGRGQGIAAVIVAAIAPVVFFTVAIVAVGFGAASGAVTLYSA